MPKNNPLKEVIASRLRLAREQAGLSQNQAAKLLGLQRPAISEIEAGRRKISADEIAQLSEIYDVDVSWLLSTKQTEFNETYEKFELAAREFSKLNPEDAKRLLDVLSTLKGSEK